MVNLLLLYSTVNRKHLSSCPLILLKMAGWRGFIRAHWEQAKIHTKVPVCFLCREGMCQISGPCGQRSFSQVDDHAHGTQRDPGTVPGDQSSSWRRRLVQPSWYREVCVQHHVSSTTRLGWTSKLCPQCFRPRQSPWLLRHQVLWDHQWSGSHAFFGLFCKRPGHWMSAPPWISVSWLMCTQNKIKIKKHSLDCQKPRDSSPLFLHFFYSIHEHSGRPSEELTHQRDSTRNIDALTVQSVRQTDRQTCGQKNIQTDRQTDMWTEEQKDRQTCGQKNRKTDRHVDRRTERQTHRHVDRRTDRQTDRQDIQERVTGTPGATWQQLHCVVLCWVQCSLLIITLTQDGSFSKSFLLSSPPLIYPPWKLLWTCLWIYKNEAVQGTSKLATFWCHAKYATRFHWPTRERTTPIPSSHIKSILASLREDGRPENAQQRNNGQTYMAFMSKTASHSQPSQPNVWFLLFWACQCSPVFRPSATVSRIGLMESCTYHCHCRGGPPPLLADPPPGWQTPATWRMVGALGLCAD